MEIASALRIVFALMWAGPLAAWLVGVETIDVFVLAGQSNMEGRAHRRDLPPALAAPQKAVLFYHEDAWEPLAPGSSRRPAPPDGFGPELSFGQTLAEKWPSGRKIALIKHAVGGTSLSDDWRPPGGVQTKEMLRKVRLATSELEKRGFACRLAAFIWMQGERDAGTKEQAEPYAARLQEFILHVRQELAAPELPFVIGKVTPHSKPARPFSDVVRRAQEEVVRSMRRTVLVNTDDLRLFEETAPDGRPVNVHFDGPSLVTLGRRLALEALRFQPEPNIRR